MFGDLDKFMDETFFENHTTGKLYLPDRTLTLETTAIIMADAYDRIIYDVSERTEDEKLALISEIEKYALHTRGTPMHMEDQFIALSTCSSDYTNARLLLICRVTCLLYTSLSFNIVLRADYCIWTSTSKYKPNCTIKSD